jgi:transposase-like protein
MAYLEVENKESSLVIKTGLGVMELRNDQVNKKLCLIYLRMWTDPETGKAIYTYQQIADAFGYADRRNVHNYWQEFTNCEGKFLDFVLRKRKIDTRVVEAVAEQLPINMQSPLAQLCAQTNERLGRCDLTVANIHTALEQIPCTVIRDEVVTKWEEGSFHPREEIILEEAMSALEGHEESGHREHRVQEILSKVGIKPSEDHQDEVVQQGQWDALSDLLKPDLPASNLSERIRQMVFALNLYYWNVPLSRIGLWLGVSKSTVYGWIIGLTQALWAVISVWVVNRVKASQIYIDEKWLKIQGKWHYWFVALDQATGLPILGHLLPTRTKWACRWFLIKLKRLGKYPLMIITDGLAAYVSSIAKTFSRAKHVLCVFHHQQGVSRWVKQHLSALKAAEQVKKKMKRVIQTQDVRTIKRRLKKLEAEDATHKWGISSWIALTWKNLTALIPALRSNSYPKTTNAIERFFRAFQRFYKTRGGFHSVVSAKRELILFLVVYLFTQQTETKKAPIETIVPEARRMPFYRLLNYPFECGMPNIAFNNKQLAKMATENLMEPG